MKTMTLDEEIFQAITEQAREARPGRALLSVIGWLLFMIGFLAAKSFRVAFFCGAWAFAAMVVGWRQARGEPLRQPTAAHLLAENEALRHELARITPTMS